MLPEMLPSEKDCAFRPETAVCSAEKTSMAFARSSRPLDAVCRKSRRNRRASAKSLRILRPAPGRPADSDGRTCLGGQILPGPATFTARYRCNR